MRYLKAVSTILYFNETLKTDPQFCILMRYLKAVSTILYFNETLKDCIHSSVF